MSILFADWYESNEGCGNGIYEGNTPKEKLKDLFFSGDMSKYTIVYTTAIPSKSIVGLRLQIVLTEDNTKFVVIPVESSKETGSVPYKLPSHSVDFMFKNNIDCFDNIEEAKVFIK